MDVQNPEIAEIFNRYADLLEIQDANPFRVRAYRNAARTVGAESRSMADLVARHEDLTELPGIGKDLAAKIAVIVGTGRLPELAELETRVPRALSDLMRLPGLGPKRVKQIYRGLHIRSQEDLARAIRSGELARLPGFGATLVRKIAGGLALDQAARSRMKLADAERYVAPLLAHLKQAPGAARVEVAGSFRRRQETVGDLDIVVASARGSAVMRHFTRYGDIAEVLAQGDTRSSVRLRSGLQVDVRVVPEASFGAALYYFTGSKAHVVATRKLAVDKGLKMNEYGLYRGLRKLAGRTEAEMFKSLGMEYVPPELREDRGEIGAARRHRLPALLALKDLRGDLHCHTRETDGVDGLERMAEAARRRGYEYLAITDHSRRLTVAHGMNTRRLRAQATAIDELNAKFRGFRLLKSVEVDILEDGTLDLPDTVLKELDLVVGAVHYKFDLSPGQQTRRLLRAMDNPHLDILAHPSCRLIGTRPPIGYDFERVAQGAQERGCCLEVDAQPERLDLDDVHCRTAKDLGTKLVISSDAHSAQALSLIRFGVDQARRGWIGPGDVLNTLPLDRLLATLRH